MITREERRELINEGRRYAYEEAAEYLETYHNDTWGANHLRSRCPAPKPEPKIDRRPDACRDRLCDEGKPYPKSGCSHCLTGGMLGCPFEEKL